MINICLQETVSFRLAGTAYQMHACKKYAFSLQSWTAAGVGNSVCLLCMLAKYMLNVSCMWTLLLGHYSLTQRSGLQQNSIAL